MSCAKRAIDRDMLPGQEICNKVACLLYLRAMNLRINWDALGVSASVACAIHCAVLPLIAASLPVFGVDIIDNVAFEYGMIFLAFAIGSWSMWHGFKKHHHSLVPMFIFLSGIVFLLLKQVWHQYQLWFLPVAVALIIIAHVMNYRACRVHNHAHSDDCNH